MFDKGGGRRGGSSDERVKILLPELWAVCRDTGVEIVSSTSWVFERRSSQESHDTNRWIAPTKPSR